MHFSKKENGLSSEEFEKLVGSRESLVLCHSFIGTKASTRDVVEDPLTWSGPGVS